jgi:hypothetical protein
MIEATVAIVVMAGLFVLFGTLRLADRRGCDGGCAGCGNACDRHGEIGTPPHAGHPARSAPRDVEPHAGGGVS